MNLIEWLLSEKIATHWKQAQNIIAGLELGSLYNTGDYDGIKTRSRLYRDWRNSQVFGKDTKACYEKAIAGEPVPVAPMFDGVLHSDSEWQDAIHEGIMNGEDEL